MKKNHFLHLARSISKVLDTWAEWSEPGTDGRQIGLYVAETVLLDGLADFVAAEYGDGEKFKDTVRFTRRRHE